MMMMRPDVSTIEVGPFSRRQAYRGDGYHAMTPRVLLYWPMGCARLFKNAESFTNCCSLLAVRRRYCAISLMGATLELWKNGLRVFRVPTCFFCRAHVSVYSILRMARGFREFNYVML